MNKVVERILNLRRHAASARGFGSHLEADAFEARALRLMRKYGVTEAQLAEASAPDFAALVVPPEEYGERAQARRAAWSEMLADAIARAHSCRSAVKPRSNTVLFFGTRPDLAAAARLFVTLARACARESVTDARAVRDLFEEYWPGEWPGERAYSDSFRVGYAEAVRERLAVMLAGEGPAAREEVPAAARAGALVRRRAPRGERVEARLAGLVRGSARRLKFTGDSRPLWRGYVAGMSAPLEGAALEGGGGRGALPPGQRAFVF